MPTLIGQIDQQQDVYAIELRNGRGDSVRILTYGAIIAELNISTNNHGLSIQYWGTPIGPAIKKIRHSTAPLQAATVIALPTVSSSWNRRTISYTATKALTSYTGGPRDLAVKTGRLKPVMNNM